MLRFIIFKSDRIFSSWLVRGQASAWRRGSYWTSLLSVIRGYPYNLSLSPVVPARVLHSSPLVYSSIFPSCSIILAFPSSLDSLQVSLHHWHVSAGIPLQMWPVTMSEGYSLTSWSMQSLLPSYLCLSGMWSLVGDWDYSERNESCSLPGFARRVLSGLAKEPSRTAEEEALVQRKEGWSWSSRVCSILCKLLLYL